MTTRILTCCCLLASLLISSGWGFFGHTEINRLAVFTLPPEMLGFYKANLQYISEHSTSPDKRRYVVPDEAPRHYLDLDHYDRGLDELPRYWKGAVDSFGIDTLQEHGILPWHITKVVDQLSAAFRDHRVADVLRLSADLGHYVADAQVPLHTTENYNGQKTGQHGIHALWESRLPELFASDYDFWVGKASYAEDVDDRVWRTISESHNLVDSVLLIEAELSAKYGERKYGFETKGRQVAKVVSQEFSNEYHRRLDGMVEHQMRKAIKMTGDLWYTAWVNAGQPDINDWSGKLLRDQRKEMQANRRRLMVRPHE